MIRNRKSDGNLNNHPCIQNTESQSGETERHQNEINIQIANDMADGCLQGNQAVSYVTGENNSASAGNLVQQELVRSQTETMSLATTLDSTIYNTPMTSCSGFDVYITAAEESSYSLGGHSVGFDNKIASDYQLSTESKDNTANERRAQMLRSEPDLHLSSRCKSSGTCTFKDPFGLNFLISLLSQVDSGFSSFEDADESVDFLGEYFLLSPILSPKGNYGRYESHLHSKGKSFFITIHSKTCLNRISFGINFCVRNREEFSL
jgi:hypothetical protein